MRTKKEIKFTKPVEENESPVLFSVGSFTFTNFKELYENIKGRTVAFSSTCIVLKDGQSVLSFPIKYEKTQEKHRFIIEFTSQEFTLLKMNKEVVALTKSKFPKFQRVGCTTEGYMSGEKYIGYLDISKL